MKRMSILLLIVVLMNLVPSLCFFAQSSPKKAIVRFTPTFVINNITIFYELDTKNKQMRFDVTIDNTHGKYIGCDLRPVIVKEGSKYW